MTRSSYSLSSILTRNNDDPWHKFLAILLIKAGVDEFLITEADVSKAFATINGRVIAALEDEDGLHIRLMGGPMVTQ